MRVFSPHSRRRAARRISLAASALRAAEGYVGKGDGARALMRLRGRRWSPPQQIMQLGDVCGGRFGD